MGKNPSALPFLHLLDLVNMANRLEDIEEAIKTFNGALIINSFEEEGLVIKGRISMTVDDNMLEFDLEIYPQYPFQFHDSETIRFINKDLLDFGHVNSDGSICVHTLHHPKLSEKILLDLNGLKHWISKYFINKEVDDTYEHIVVDHKVVNGRRSVFLFTEVNHSFKKGDYGEIKYSLLNGGVWRKEKYVTMLVKKFKFNKIEVKCNWNSTYNEIEENEGFFYFSDRPPVKNNRFAVSSFVQLEEYFSQQFLKDLYSYSKGLHRKSFIDHVPLLIGYPISKTEIHWEAILIPFDEFPTYGQKIPGSINWISRLADQPILWAQTRNSSYNSFFGRGAFNSKITHSKILIVGIGAIGSMVATTLVRGGALDITIVDHDIKEPENVCRSEYSFYHGLTAKTKELALQLTSISPFVEITTSEEITDLFKTVVPGDSSGWRYAIEDYLNQYDLIFDCSTDNDIAFLFDALSLRCEIYSLSVTNHARELVCGCKHNLYAWLQKIFHHLANEKNDLYSPTGCWSPTFKASYNDISVLVQFALHHINDCYNKNLPVRHFYLTCEDANNFNIKLNQS